MYGTCGRIDNKADFDLTFDFETEVRMLGWTTWTSTLTWTALGKDMGPVKASRKSLGEIMEPAKLIWKLKREKTHGNPTETPRENDKLTLEQPAQGIDERISQDSKLTELKLNPHRNKRHHRVSTHKN